MYMHLFNSTSNVDVPRTHLFMFIDGPGTRHIIKLLQNTKLWNDLPFFQFISIHGM